MYKRENYEKMMWSYCGNRDGLKELLDFLPRTDFYTAPASTRFHGADVGCLCDHSTDVIYKMLDEIKDTSLSIESAVLVAGCHDLCKIGYYKPDTRNVKENGIWKQVPYFSVEDKFPLGHGEKSVIMAMQFMKLTDEEILAIRWHMGGFVPKDEYNYLSDAYNMCPLAVLLHVADMKSTYLEKK